MKFVLDTDVIRSGLQSDGGASRLLMCAVEEGLFIPLVTVAIALEYDDALLRRESLLATGHVVDDVFNFLKGFLLRSEYVAVRRRIRPSIQDPSDEMSVEALVNGGGDAIVTFNSRDYLDSDHVLASAGKMPVPVIAPAEALRRLPWRPTAITPFVFRPR